jgi:hypothetical protein
MLTSILHLYGSLLQTMLTSILHLYGLLLQTMLASILQALGFFLQLVIPVNHFPGVLPTVLFYILTSSSPSFLCMHFCLVNCHHRFQEKDYLDKCTCILLDLRYVASRGDCIFYSTQILKQISVTDLRESATTSRHQVKTEQSSA